MFNTHKHLLVNLSKLSTVLNKRVNIKTLNTVADYSQPGLLYECKDENLARIVLNDLICIPNFISECDENNLMKELDPLLSRLRYESSHWDSAIENFRELERKTWRKDSKTSIDKLRELTLDFMKDEVRPISSPSPKDFSDLLPLVHVLDLASSGWIKPHVDSIRFCGGIISVLSLLSHCVARFAVAKASEVAPFTEQLPASIPGILMPPDDTFIDVFLPQRSLYVMRGVTRYRLTHAILPNPSQVCGREIQRERRVSLICRTRPVSETSDNGSSTNSYTYASPS